uniref:Uncharacterized protein n=1 Tax=Arundo donax TaxID=35708 RepID=A0A0A9BY75_ARUDO
MALIPLSEASVSIVNCLEKSGIARTGAWVRACLRAWKESSVTEVHTNSSPFLSRLVKVLLISPKFLTKLL